jgi:hypothetical protein
MTRDGGNTRGGNQPQYDPDLGPLSDPQASLVDSLGSVVDDLRQIATELGARPYRVFSVRIGWSGGERGRGSSRILCEEELLPTPFVKEWFVRRELENVGSVERGVVELREISPRYTEAQIMSLCPYPCGPDAQGNETFIELRIDSRDGTQAKPRRFVIANAPFLDAERFEWRVKLIPQEGARV